MARLSILTRTINRPQLLGRTLDSMAAQTFADWECVIVNGGDEAAVQRVIEPRAAALAGRVKVVPFTNPKPGMRGLPLNHGIEHSSGELITVLDDDDTWAPTFLAEMIAALDRAPVPEVMGVVCHTKMIEETSVEAGLQVTKEWMLNEDLQNLTLPRLAMVNCFCTHAFLYKRTALAQCGMYADDLPVLEDWDFNLRFLLHHEILVLPKALTNYHWRPAVSGGAEANSQTGELDMHKFHEARIINKHLRADLASGKPGLGSLLSNATLSREVDRRLRSMENKLRQASEKIGKIDSRTKELKDGKR